MKPQANLQVSNYDKDGNFTGSTVLSVEVITSFLSQKKWEDNGWSDKYGCGVSEMANFLQDKVEQKSFKSSDTMIFLRVLFCFIHHQTIDTFDKFCDIIDPGNIEEFTQTWSAVYSRAVAGRSTTKN
jgi:hypothetical protein